MSLGGRIDRLLDSIPGYAGYRDKERRRDSDRVVREKLALDYGQLAERLGRLATTLAQERQIAAIALVDRPHKRLVSFIDRVRTASYGYSPLFSDTPVDELALDQLAAFDRSLADAQDDLREKIALMEAGNPRDAEYKTISQSLTATIEGLHDRFDRRHEILHAGNPLPPADVLRLLNAPTTAGSSIAFRLHEGEALEYDDRDYSVVGRVSAEADGVSWRAFQLRGGTDDHWLQSTPDPNAKLLWLRRVSVDGSMSDPSVTVNGETYNRDSLHAGTGHVIGQQGQAKGQPLRFGRFSRTDGQRVLAMYEWDTGLLALEGVQVDPGEVRLFTREL